MKLNKDEELWLKGFEKVPSDMVDYVKGLFTELYMCYDYMTDKEEHVIVKNFFREKVGVNYNFMNLLKNRDLNIMIQKEFDKKSNKKGA